MARVLVLDGHSAAALAFSRSLGRAGHWISVGSNQGIFAPAALSRYCRKSFEYPVSTDDAAAFSIAVLEFVRANQVELVVPITDWTTIPMSRFRGQFDGVCRVALPSHAALELASDKYATIELARSLNVPVPHTWLIRSADDLNALPELSYPIVVKDRASARWSGNRAVFGSVAYACSKEDLYRRVEQRLNVAGDVLVQKFATGEGVGFSCFMVNGQIYLPFQWVRIREVDPRGSGSSSRKSVPLDPCIAEFSEKLILQTGLEGIAMVEFKNDRQGQPILMEINGRPWGSLQLPIASGIDYPRYLLDWTLEEKLPPREIGYKKGITCRRMVGELTHLHNLRRGKPPGWPASYPNFWTSFLKIAVPWHPGMRYDDLSLWDPRPGVAGLLNWFRQRLSNKQPTSGDGQCKARGLVHCHTTFSYDGKLSLPEFCALLQREGFHFVGLTEHTQGLGPERYAELVRACREQSDDKFVAIPGLEFRCRDGVEIAGVGLLQWLTDEAPAEMTADIRQAGGFAIWVHPFKRGTWTGPFLDCDAVEVLNGKLDGVLAPNLSLLREYARQRRQGRSFHAIFGLDFHNSQQARGAWIECEVDELTQEAIVSALRDGKFVSRVPHGSMASNGKLKFVDYTTIIGLRSAFVLWAFVLRNLPNSVRNSLLTASRPVVRMLKRRG